MTDEELMNAMLTIDKMTARIPPGVRKIVDYVIAIEREACANVCDEMAHGWENNPGTNPLAGYVASSNCAVEIRARSRK